MNSADSANFSRTSATPTDQTKWTYSTWLKRGNTDTRQTWGLSATSSGTSYFQFYGHPSTGTGDDDRLYINVESDGTSGGTGLLRTNGYYSDISAWYHFVVIYDSNNDVPTERMKLYINGKLEGNFGTYTDPADGSTGVINKGGITQLIGQQSGSSNYFDGYLSQCVFCDGQAYGPENFGEYDSYGVWRPKDPSGLTFGDNGFYLDFADSSALGNDVSGNNNDFTANNLAAADRVPDTPTDNYAVWNNRVYNSNAVTFSEGNTKIIAVNSGYPGDWTIIPSTFLIPPTGKWCWKVTNVIANAFQAPGFMGNSLEGHWGDGNSTSVVAHDFVQYYIAAGELTSYINNSASTQSVTAGSTGTAGIELYVDNDANTVKVYLGGTQLGSTITGLATMQYAFIQVYDANNRGVETDFGQYGFTRTDDSYNYLSTANLPEASVKEGRKYFYPIVYTGNSEAQTVGANDPITDPHEVSSSALFVDADNTYLSRTPSGAGNRRAFTFSFWLKRTLTGSQQIIWSSAGGSFFFEFLATDQFKMYTNGSGDYETNDVFQDVDQWHNFVMAFDSANSTASDRFKLYVDGVQITDWDTETTMSQDTDLDMTAAVEQKIGRYLTSTGIDLDGYMAEVVLIDGTTLDADSFGQVDTTTNRWVPKDVSGLTFGTTGFYLDFADKNDLGDDESGNNNDWAENGFDTTNGSNQFHDTPTRNFATYNPYQMGLNSATSNGNLFWKVTSGASGYRCRSTFNNPKTGKWYAEFDCNTQSGSYPYIYMFIDLYDEVDTHTNTNGVYLSAAGYFQVNFEGSYYANTFSSATYAAGDVISVAIDCDNDKLWIAKNDSWISELGGDPDSGGEGIYFPFSKLEGTLFNAQSHSSHGFFLNFGQWQYYADTDLSETSAAKGFFKYTPPTGFKACNNDNMKDIDSYQTGLQWTKNRSATDNHMLFDRVRGPYVDMHPNASSSDVTNINTLQRFLKQGHQIGNDVQVNTKDEEYIGWNWFLETIGNGTSNTAGSTNTIRTLVDTNAGVSVSIFPSNNGSVHTIGHGLGKKPKWILVNKTGGFWTYHEGTTISDPEDYGVTLYGTSYRTDATTLWNDTAPTTTLYTVGTSSDINAGTTQCLGIAFAEIEGFSRFERYVGNGSADGEYVFCGFRPAFIIIKNVSASGNWVMYDTRRSRLNPVEDQLLANTTAAETTGSEEIAIYSTGFKCLTADSDINSSDAEYIFCAWAEHPFGGDSTTPVVAR
jgi:hypothetical protein